VGELGAGNLPMASYGCILSNESPTSHNSFMHRGGPRMRLLAPQIWNVPHPWALPIGNHESNVIMDLNIHRLICIRGEGLLGLCVFIGIRSLPLLRNRHKKPPLISGVILTEVRCPLIHLEIAPSALNAYVKIV